MSKRGSSLHVSISPINFTISPLEINVLENYDYSGYVCLHRPAFQALTSKIKWLMFSMHNFLNQMKN